MSLEVIILVIWATNDESVAVSYTHLDVYKRQVYTSTVHGMAYDITGQGIADESGMRNALYLAIDVYNNRQMNAELAQNPLRHYDIASNSNESDLNVEQIAGIEKEME